MSDKRIKITGYYTPEPDELDPDSASGVTEEAYLQFVAGDGGPALKLSDLEDVDLEVER
jgi:hypothetical protein